MRSTGFFYRRSEGFEHVAGLFGVGPKDNFAQAVYGCFFVADQIGQVLQSFDGRFEFIVAIFANFIAPYPLGKISLLEKLQPPSIDHPLGTDQLGRDELSNIIYGARVSVIIGVVATIIMTVVSVFIGATSGYIGGKFDLIVQRFVDAWLSMPSLLVLLVLMTILGNGTLQVILAIGVPMGIAMSRMIRSAVMAIKENIYVDAARSIGCTTGMIMRWHILPNIMPVVIIAFSMWLGGTIMIEASLSFLGFGVPPGVPSWGSMLSREGRIYMQQAPALSIWPGLALAITVYGVNMLGDAIRDLLDPRLKGGMGRYGSTVKRLKFQEKQKQRSAE